MSRKSQLFSSCSSLRCAFAGTPLCDPWEKGIEDARYQICIFSQDKSTKNSPCSLRLGGSPLVGALTISSCLRGNYPRLTASRGCGRLTAKRA